MATLIHRAEPVISPKISCETSHARPRLSATGAALLPSRDTGAGPIEESEILAHTPEAFAAAFLAALSALAADGSHGATDTP